MLEPRKVPYIVRCRRLFGDFASELFYELRLLVVFVFVALLLRLRFRNFAPELPGQLFSELILFWRLLQFVRARIF